MRVVLCLILLCATCFSIVFASPEIFINIPEYTLTVSDKGQTIKTYSIAVGTPYEQTPVGQFSIFLKQEYPTWYPGAKFTDRTPVPPGPDNPLGTRWMEFSPSYGIHGTNNDWSIEYPVSGGCIRMHDKDARELYNMVDIGTPVTVVYETLRVIEKPDGLYLKVFPDIYRRETSNSAKFHALYALYAGTYQLIKEPSFPLKETDDPFELKFAVLNTPAAPPKQATATPKAAIDKPATEKPAQPR